MSSRPPEKIRKRGKKPSQRHKQEAEAAGPAVVQAAPAPAPAPDAATTEHPAVASGGGDHNDAQPDWIRSDPSSSSKQASDAPFGFVDIEVKAYFRQIWTTLQELETQGYRSQNTFSELEQITNPHTAAYANGASYDNDAADDQLALLIKAILSEVDGKELMLATDPDTSIVMEGLVQRIGQKPLRVLMDRMAGNYTTLACHRFGSHVLETCLAALQPAITAENRRDGAKGKARLAEIVSKEGVLRSSTHIFLGFCSELEESLQELTKDAFGSHVLRSTLLLLTGQSIQSTAAQRSKRSSKFRQKKTGASGGELEEDPIARPSADTKVVIPSSFLATLRRLTSAGFAGLGSAEVRSLAIDTVASPVLQLFMSLEALELQDKAGEDGEGAWKGSLTDIVLDGLVSRAATGEERRRGGAEAATSAERSDHLESCLRDSVASHALQVAVSVAPTSAVELFYSLYVSGRLGQLGSHPSARHVVIECLRRLATPSLLGSTIEECSKVGEALVKQAALGVLQALLERCGALQVQEKEAVKTVLIAFKLVNKDGVFNDEREVKAVLPVLLSGKTKKAYYKALAAASSAGGADRAEKKGKKGGKRDLKRKRGGEKKVDDAQADEEEAEANEEAATVAEIERADEHEQNGDTATTAAVEVTPGPLSEDLISTPGSLLLQTLCRLSSPHNEVVVTSLLAQASLLPLACNATASHIILACLNSSTMSFAQRRKIVMALLPDMHVLVDDKWGSRVADAVWARADGFTKEKLTTLLAHERHLLSSYYGAFFLRKLNLALFRKPNKMREWRDFVSKTDAPSFSITLLEEEQGRQAGAVLGGDSGNREVVENDEEMMGKGNKRAKEKVDRELDDILAQF